MNNLVDKLNICMYKYRDAHESRDRASETWRMTNVAMASCCHCCCCCHCCHHGGILGCVSGKVDEKRAPEADLRSVSNNTAQSYNTVRQSHWQFLCLLMCAASLMTSETTSCQLAHLPNHPKTRRDTERETEMMTARAAGTHTATLRSHGGMNTRSHSH